MDPQHQPGDLSHQSGQASFNPPQFGQTAQFGQVSQPGQQLPGFPEQHTQVQQPGQLNHRPQQPAKTQANMQQQGPFITDMQDFRNYSSRINTCKAICLPRHHPMVPLDFADRVRDAIVDLKVHRLSDDLGVKVFVRVYTEQISEKVGTAAPNFYTPSHHHVRTNPKVVGEGAPFVYNGKYTHTQKYTFPGKWGLKLKTGPLIEELVENEEFLHTCRESRKANMPYSRMNSAARIRKSFSASRLRPPQDRSGAKIRRLDRCRQSPRQNAGAGVYRGRRRAAPPTPSSPPPNIPPVAQQPPNFSPADQNPVQQPPAMNTQQPPNFSPAAQHPSNPPNFTQQHPGFSQYA
ncbi:hypothetical protein VE04_00271 [Pseudogymnoascus sp. 24MN13]|nr:hypothetical protein VE04_00271 [Pseudogymnoascus sp. 24MN13]